MNETMKLGGGTQTAAPRPDYRTEIVRLLQSTLTPKPLKERVLTYHENDIAAAMELLSREERNRLYSILDAESLAGVLEYSGRLNEYIGELSVRRRRSSPGWKPPRLWSASSRWRSPGGPR